MPRVPTARDWSECLTQAARRVDTKQGVVEYAERGDGPALLRIESVEEILGHWGHEDR